MSAIMISGGRCPGGNVLQSYFSTGDRRAAATELRY